ncbi:expressed unknown protein [Seminavis robusta]|uniref:Uncharacterized protein n=1 Tax=Seminavis robusta TaxID=568900 RepID=A0A9N8ETB5_9STRA|nr:expressed unknown protein [Seminavis robusta]|eukprot:Sro1637_g287650.1 n/a (99) ;mRNA; r:12591-12887
MKIVNLIPVISALLLVSGVSARLNMARKKQRKLQGGEGGPEGGKPPGGMEGGMEGGMDAAGMGLGPPMLEEVESAWPTDTMWPTEWATLYDTPAETDQ